MLTIQAIAGYIADRIQSRRWPLLIGLIALGASTALLCVGTALGLWIAGRIFQGLSGAVVWTVGLALLVDSIDKEAMGQAMGFAGMAATLGIMAGPLLGGVIYGKGGYYAVFGLCFGLIGIDIFLRLVMIERKYLALWVEPEKSSAEQPSEQPSTSEQPQEKETLTEAAPSSSNAPEAQTIEPPADAFSPKPRRNPVLTLLSSERILVSIWAYFIISLIFTSFDSVLPIFVQDTFSWKQTAQGLIFIPLSVPNFLDPLVGRIIDKKPNLRRYFAAAAFFCAIPIMVLLRLVDHNSMSQKVLLCALLALVGCCMVICMVPLLIEITFAVYDKEAESPNIFGKGGAMALAYGILNAAYAAGSVAGPFFAGFIRKTAGWGTMGWALAIITGVSGIPLLLYVDGPLWRRKERRDDGPGVG